MIEVEGKGSRSAPAPRLMVPKWFDKRPHLDPATKHRKNCDSLWRSHETFISRSPGSIPPLVFMRLASVIRLLRARRRTFRRLPPPLARPKSTKRSSTRCCAHSASNVFDGMARQRRRPRCAIGARSSAATTSRHFSPAGSRLDAGRDPAHRGPGRCDRRAGRCRRPRGEWQ